MLDSLLDKGRRERMVKILSANPMVEREVAEVMRRIPRHLFVEKGLGHSAYDDKPLSISWGQTISQPSTVAVQTSLLGLKRGEKVLEIGTGCGYQTAVLELLGGDVYSVERIAALHDMAEANLKSIGCFGVNLFLADGNMGLPQYAPFDKILVTCAAEEIPHELVLQLSVGGTMVVPVVCREAENKSCLEAGNKSCREAEKREQQMMVVKRISQTEYDIRNMGACSFVPMLKGTV